MEHITVQFQDAGDQRKQNSSDPIRILSVEEIASVGGGEIGTDEYPLPTR